ncbi:MAG: 2-amino-4-hydroxy-6-hydroxymethyldihydropteridine diphosphokinase [Ignavibacteria bacterium]|nr:2-amino-4-hydroxy-6-hydroxymethyldihydropteridine diphosphokinase [Ignavibacteria bacterium]
MEVLISLGSNIEPRLRFIQNAVQELKPYITIVGVSLMYETEPVGFKDQSAFINVVVFGNTSLTPDELHQRCKEIEEKLGRTKREQWHEREIDIDVLIAGDYVVDSPQLTLPHPRMHERRFVLVPAAKVAPQLMHPVLQLNIQQLLAECSDTSDVYVYYSVAQD